MSDEVEQATAAPGEMRVGPVVGPKVAALRSAIRAAMSAGVSAEAHEILQAALDA